VESEQPYTRYVAARVSLYRQLDRIRGEVDAWLGEIATRVPTMSDVAQLETFHSQRQRVLSELQDAEDRFLDLLVSRIGNASPSTASSAPSRDGASPSSDGASPSQEGAALTHESTLQSRDDASQAQNLPPAP
jgi:hypothetical protein